MMLTLRSPGKVAYDRFVPGAGTVKGIATIFRLSA